MKHTIPYLYKCTRSYLNQRTGEHTKSASVALQWHKDGDRVQMNKNNPSGSLRDCSVIDGATQHTTHDENFEYCKSIATDLEAYENGDVHQCPECGEKIVFPDGVGDKFKCPHCGEVNDTDDFDQLSIYDYFDDILDIEYLVDSKKEYKACKICVTWGGPSVYIDTESRAVELYWWGQRASYSLLSSTIDAVDEWAEECYNSI